MIEEKDFSQNDQSNTDVNNINQNDYDNQNTVGNGDMLQPPMPVYFVEPDKESRPKDKAKKKRTRKIVAAVVAVAIIAGLLGTFFTFYEIVPGDGNTLFSMSRRNWGEDNKFLNLIPDIGQRDEADDDSEDRLEIDRKNDGPEMVINSIPSEPSPSSLANGSRRELTIPEIAEKVMPSTVGVVTTVGSVYGTTNYSGTGIIMSEDGYIITNNHVIKNADVITITLMDGTNYEAKLVGGDARSDLAVVKIDAKGLTPAEFGDSDALRVGELAVAIGNPLGLELMGTVTDGIISAINRDVVVEERTMTLIQTNAAINAGNSGGPLINKYGQVIGINTLKMQDYYTNVEGLGFAIPTNTAKDIIDELIAYGYVKGRPAIGISGYTLDIYRARKYNYPLGVVVTYVSPNSDAYAKGLKVYDIITKAQGQEVRSTEEINRIKENYVAGDNFTFTVYRSGKYFDITFKLMDEAEIDIEKEINQLQP